MNALLLWSLAVQAGAPVAPPANGLDTSAATLQRMTQELVDGITNGDSAPWRRYLDERVSFTDENGARLTRAQLIAQARPLPPGVSGSIRVTDFSVQLHGQVAVTTYVDDEHEHFHGQDLHAQYRETDTWIRDGASWKMIGAQALALQEDPPHVQLADDVLGSYVGRYRAAPDYVYAITRDSTGLWGRVNDGPPQRLLAEIQDVLFVPGQPRVRKLIQRNGAGAGAVTGFVSRREGRDVVFTREP